MRAKSGQIIVIIFSIALLFWSHARADQTPRVLAEGELKSTLSSTARSTELSPAPAKADRDDDDDDDSAEDDIAAAPAAADASISSRTANPVSRPEKMEIAGNVTLTSDYLLRGYTQTGHRPALQGGFDRDPEEGIYFGIWGSNVYFPDDDQSSPTLELDYSAGYQYRFNKDLSARLGVTYLDYFDDATRSGVNVPLRMDYRAWSAEADYSPDWQGQGQSWYLLLSHTQKFPWKVKLVTSLGYAIVSNDESQNYPDAEIDVSRKIFTVDCHIAAVLVQTQSSNDQEASSRLVLSASQNF